MSSQLSEIEMMFKVDRTAPSEVQANIFEEIAYRIRALGGRIVSSSFSDPNNPQLLIIRIDSKDEEKIRRAFPYSNKE